MKIEKISDNQIRCTLSKQDLTDRELRLSELAYGTEKAKALFRDMIQQASYEFGFEADDIPLMIEAIPVSPDCLVLVITKVEDPDELDTRFSKFSPDQEVENFSSEEEEDVSYADEILHCFEQLHDIIDGCLEDDSDDNELAIEDDTEEDDDIIMSKNPPAKKDTASKKKKEAEFIPLSEAISKKNGGISKKAVSEPASTHTNLTKVFSFQTLDDISRLAAHVVYSYHGVNTLYKDAARGKYYLVITKSDHTPEEFNKICNIISEYGKSERTTYASPAYYQEHFEIIIKDKAIQILSTM